jgi:hypothetical protein
MRRAVYPFEKGHALESNLVTLLAWAHEAGVGPSEPNVFFEAWQKDPESWRSVERDVGRRSLWIEPYWFGLVTTWVFFVLSIVVLGITLIWKPGWAEFSNAYLPLVDRSGWFIVLYFLIGPSTILVIKILSMSFNIFRFTEYRNSSNQIFNFIDISSDIVGGDSRFDFYDLYLDDYFFYIVLVLNLIISSLFWQIVLRGVYWPFQFFGSITLTLLFFWLPATRLFEEEYRLYIRKPNSFIHMYDDQRSVAWIRKAPAVEAAG